MEVWLIDLYDSDFFKNTNFGTNESSYVPESSNDPLTTFFDLLFLKLMLIKQKLYNNNNNNNNNKDLLL